MNRSPKSEFSITWVDVVLLLHMASLKSCSSSILTHCVSWAYFTHAVKYSQNTSQSACCLRWRKNHLRISLNEHHLKCYLTNQNGTPMVPSSKLWREESLHVLVLKTDLLPKLADRTVIWSLDGFWQSPLTNKNSLPVFQCLLQNNFKHVVSSPRYPRPVISLSPISYNVGDGGRLLLTLYSIS